MATRILKKPEVTEKTSLSISSITRLEEKGEFPARVELGPCSVGSFEDEVDEWVERQRHRPKRLQSGGARLLRRNGACE